MASSFAVETAVSSEERGRERERGRDREGERKREGERGGREKRERGHFREEEDSLPRKAISRSADSHNGRMKNALPLIGRKSVN